MNNEIDFKSMPRDYVVCWHVGCPMADDCLRRLAAEHLPESKTVAKSVNLRAVNPATGHCHLRRPIRWVRNAYGMRHIYDDVRTGDKERLYHTIWSKLGNSMYYRYRNGQRPISPELQAWIESAFRQLGYTNPVRFDRYSDAPAW